MSLVLLNVQPPRTMDIHNNKKIEEQKKTFKKIKKENKPGGVRTPSEFCIRSNIHNTKKHFKGLLKPPFSSFMSKNIRKRYTDSALKFEKSAIFGKLQLFSSKRLKSTVFDFYSD